MYKGGGGDAMISRVLQYAMAVCCRANPGSMQCQNADPVRAPDAMHAKNTES